MSYIDILGQKAKACKKDIAFASTTQKNDALLEIAHILRVCKDDIIEANKVDLENGRMRKMSEAMLDRLALNDSRIEGMAKACEELAQLDDPVGEVVSGSTRPNGMKIEKVRVPMGVIGIIFEARPNVTVDGAILCLKSGNAVILRGGKEAINSNKMLADLMRKAVERAGFSPDIIQLVEDTDRGIALDMMKANDYIDVLIPRGGAQLIKAVVQSATVPVIETGTGNCHVYVDASADIKMAVNIVDNGKTSRPSVCNAVESCLVHRDIAEDFLPKLKERLDKHHVEIRGCELTRQILGPENVTPADDDDYATEFLDYIISIKVVDDMAEALEHIDRFSTGHSECIVTESLFAAQEFQKRVDSAAVYVNCSTRFTDGGMFGQGADTVFSQMTAEVLNMDISDIHIQTVQDTDVTPFDTGAYASRQSFVTGTVVKDCANLLKKKILDYAKELLPEETRKLRLDHGWIMAGKDPAISLGNLALESYYSLGNSSVITAEVSEQVKKNTIATGCCFAEVEVDIKLGKIKILHIINVHDSGKLINPKLAEMQVQGGMSMGMGYGLSEQLILDEKTGRPLNGTLLDYKLMTMMDTPDIKADFVELDDPIGPFGNKALGEPPAIPGAPAIRNAVLHATGVAFNENPLTPQRLIDGFIRAGLI